MADHIGILKPDPRNARRHTPRNVGMIASALNDVGAARSIVIDEDNTILAGNATIEAAAQAGIERLRIIEADGEEIIAVRRSGLTPEQKTRLALFDNRAAELAEWDEAVIAELAEDVDLSGLFSDDELAALLAKLEPTPGLTDPDEVPEPPKEPITKPGDLWQLGRHRLLCGDSTVATDVERLMAGQKANMVFTDPPYGVDYVGGVSHGPKYAKKRERDGLRIDHDDLNETALYELISAAFHNTFIVSKPGAVWYVAVPAGPLNAVFGAVLHQLGVWRQTLNWVKSAFVFGRSDYHYRHEPIFYGWVEGAAHYFCGDRTQDTLWEFDRPIGKENPGHPTAKPVGLVERAIKNSSLDSALVYDPFLGSGTTLIAAEQLGRTCYGMDISPQYVDVAVTRWQNFTGQTAERIA